MITTTKFAKSFFLPIIHYIIANHIHNIIKFTW